MLDRVCIGFWGLDVINGIGAPAGSASTLLVFRKIVCGLNENVNPIIKVVYNFSHKYSQALTRTS